ncbi:MAG: hypothetical protein HY918_04555 [Candidatus Doudnabacteria bacterium]|nr:hypothetical protein [Candidatus Doudnabacteria bacterium]
MKPQKKISTIWSPELAYAIGLIATDGCLYNDKRHMAFISKDLQLIKVFMKCLGLEVKILKKKSGFVGGSFSYWVQFGDVNFYNFLLSLGLTPNKSKTIGVIKVPDIYFFDFLRGSFDGDGTVYSYYDERWKNSFAFYINFASASFNHLSWLRKKIKGFIEIKGSLSKQAYAGAYKLVFAKNDSRLLINKMYYNHTVPRLERKYKKAYNILVKDKKS